MYIQTCLNLKSQFGGKQFPFSAFVVPKIASSPSSNVSIHRNEHLVQLDLADDFSMSGSMSDLSILIGANQYHRFVSGEIKRGNEGPVATKSVFGWLVSGPVSSCSNEFSNTLLLTSSSADDMNRNLSRFWELESLSIDYSIVRIS